MTENKAAWKAFERVAWVRTGALGDLVVGLASLREMNEFFPQAKVMVVGPKLLLELLSPELYPWIDSIFAVERKAVSGVIYRRDSGRWSPNSEPQRLSQTLRGFDAVVNTQIDSARYGFEALFARVPVRVGSAPFSTAWLYTHDAPYFGKDPQIHERDAALLLLEYATPGAMRFLRSTERNRINLDDWISKSELVAKWRKLGLPEGKRADMARASETSGREPGSYVLVNPTSSRREKAWPPEKFHQLVQAEKEACAAKGVEILFLGSPSETEWLKEAAQDEFKIVQPKNLQDLQDVLSGSRGLLTNTSSLQFLAAMTGTPTTTLMGRARPEIWGPLGPHDQVVRGVPPRELAHDIFLQEQEGYRSISIDQVRPPFSSMIDLGRIR